MSRPPLSFLFPRDDGVPDAALLRRYAHDRDEAAFELLVRRYADVVWTVCRVTAGGHHAAEDAFQAAFLTLARRAASVRDNVAGWLHRVAYHAALKARPRGRSALEDAPAPAADGPSPEVSGIIHAELAALPDRYRLPLLLCDLEGLTHAEAARQLGWPVGSVSSRLARGRERLKAKLVRRGLAPAAVALAVLPLNAASPLIRSSTLAAVGGPVPSAVAALSHGVLSAMRVAKLKLTAALAAGFLGVAGVVTTFGVSAQTPADPPARADDTPRKAAPKPGDPLAGPAPASTAKKDEARPLADAKQRAHSVNRIKQILLACHNYHDANGHFPADVLGKDGKPILSWRVVVLPYINEGALYKQFKLDEPWDSDHNKKLAEAVVKVFTNGHEPRNTRYAVTFFQRPTGAGLIHDLGRKAGKGDKDDHGEGPALGGASGAPAGAAAALDVPAPRDGKIRLTDVYDGTSNTVFLVEAEKAVEWAKPDDLAFDVNKPTDVRGLFSNVLHCGMADGSVHTFAGGIGQDAAKAIFGRGDAMNFDLANYSGLGGSIGTPEENAKEAAVLLKEFEAATAALKAALEGNQKLRLDLLKQAGVRVKTSGNAALAAELLGLERLLADEQEKQRQMEAALKAARK